LRTDLSAVAWLRTNVIGPCTDTFQALLMLFLCKSNIGHWRWLGLFHEDRRESYLLIPHAVLSVLHTEYPKIAFGLHLLGWDIPSDETAFSVSVTSL
jgi:hypothetical protein